MKIWKIINIYQYFKGNIWTKILSRGTLQASPTKMLADKFFFFLIKRNKNLSTSYLNDSVYIQTITNL